VASSAEPVARVAYFYSQTCASCEGIKKDVIAPAMSKYGDRLEILYYEISDPAVYDLMIRVEEMYKPPTSGIPEVFFGTRVLVGEDEIRARFDATVAECLAAGGCSVTLPPGAPRSSAPPGATINIAYFKSIGCAECDRANYDIAYLKTRNPNVVVTEFETAESAAKLTYEALANRAGVPAEKRLVTPAVFIGQDYIIGRDIDAASLERVVGAYARAGAPTVWDSVDGGAERSITQRFLSFSALPVIGAGLIDGLNPCAFASMIFLVSYLAVARRRGREILYIGAAFTAGVFVCYTAIGIGLLAALRSLSGFVEAARVVYVATAVVCVALAVLNLRDYVRVRRGGLAEMTLQLPGFLKERVRTRIRQGSRTRRFVLAAFVTGAVVSAVELVCTGQVYLPTIVYVVGVPELRASATAYLLLYNLMFVVPLIVVFGASYFGTTSRQLTSVLERRAGAIKLLMAAVFLALAAWLTVAAI
jgi:hypothetical protein